MVGDGEGRDAERCVKLVTPFRGLRGFISEPSRSHPPTQGPETRRLSCEYLKYECTELWQLNSRARRYYIEQSAKRHTAIRSESTRLRSVFIFLPDVRTSSVETHSCRPLKPQ